MTQQKRVVRVLFRRAIAVGVFALALPLLAVHRAAPATVFDFDRLGEPLPALAVEALEGGPLALVPVARPSYVFLFASWCAPCVESLPIIRRAHEQFGDRVRFVAIDVLENRTALRALLARESLPFDIGIVEKSAIDAVIDDSARARGGSKFLLPADYLIDAHGIVRDVWHGVAVDRNGTPIDELTQKLAHLTATAPAKAPTPAP